MAKHAISFVRPATKTKIKRAECSAGTVALQEKHTRGNSRAKRSDNNLPAAHAQKGGEPPPPQQPAPTSSAGEFAEKVAQWKTAFQCPAVPGENQQADGEQPPLHQKARNNFAREFAEKRRAVGNGVPKFSHTRLQQLRRKAANRW